MSNSFQNCPSKEREAGALIHHLGSLLIADCTGDLISIPSQAEPGPGGGAGGGGGRGDMGREALDRTGHSPTAAASQREPRVTVWGTWSLHYVKQNVSFLHLPQLVITHFLCIRLSAPP